MLIEGTEQKSPLHSVETTVLSASVMSDTITQPPREVDISSFSTYTLIKATQPIHTFSFSFRKDDSPEDIEPFHKELSVYYHDPDFMVIHKPEDFLIDADTWSVQQFLQRTYPQYPLFHLVHQLDFATSGIMTLALNKQAAAHVCDLFRRRWVRKEYIALVYGWISKDYMEILSPIKEDPFYPIRMCIHVHEGKPATTILRVIQRGYLNKIKVTKVSLELHTGRRHQLRVHLASLGHPILGDPTYASAPPLGSFHPVIVTHLFPRMYLHSRYLLLPLSRCMDHKDIAICIGPNFDIQWQCQCGTSQCHCEKRYDLSEKWEFEAFRQYQEDGQCLGKNQNKRVIMKKKKKKKSKSQVTEIEENPQVNEGQK